MHEGCEHDSLSDGVSEAILDLRRENHCRVRKLLLICIVRFIEIFHNVSKYALPLDRCKLLAMIVNHASIANTRTSVLIEAEIDEGHLQLMLICRCP